MNLLLKDFTAYTKPNDQYYLSLMLKIALKKAGLSVYLSSSQISKRKPKAGATLAAISLNIRQGEIWSFGFA